jgi:arylsulfatase A-like enzyme
VATQRLLDVSTVHGRPARAASLGTGGVKRTVLAESASYRVPLPRRALLTLGLGMAETGEGSLQGGVRLTVKADGRLLFKKTLYARQAHGFHDVSLPLEGLRPQAVLDLDLRRTDAAGRPVAGADGALMGVSDPTVHDLDAYGRSRGVVLISIDTLRRDHVGAYGYPRPTTPRLDALAREGIFCEDAVSTSSWTLPAHLSMLTSLDPGRHGGVDVDHGFNRRVPTLAALLSKAGYATRAITSHLYVSAAYGLDEGFEQLDFHYDRKASDVATRAVALLDQIGDRPYFLFLHFYDPHTHFTPPQRTRELFPSAYQGPLGGLLGHFKKFTRETIPAGYLEHLLSLYDAEIRYTDEQIGRILDHMRARGLDRSTLLLVTSDHGEEFLDHGAWAHEKTLYEELVRVPLIVHGPGVKPRREAKQASLLDVMPTILAWAGLPVPSESQGRNLLEPLPEREAYGETQHTKQGTYKLFLREGQGGYKTVLSIGRERGEVVREEWFDLASDPREQVGRRPPAATAEAARQRALARFRDGRALAGAPPPVRLTPEQLESLQALGYVGT